MKTQTKPKTWMAMQRQRQVKGYESKPGLDTKGYGSEKCGKKTLLDSAPQSPGAAYP